MQNTPTIKVWDLVVRLFHWTLVCTFILAYVTEDEWMTVHAYAGYVIGGLILLRLVWGFMGTPHARFKDFVYQPSTIITYLKSLLSSHPQRFIGHNPAGGAMVIALLMALSITVITGLFAYGGEHAAGPLAGWMAQQPIWWFSLFEELHELFANFTLLLIVLHVAGVLIASIQHSENLAIAMITGRKRSL